MRADEILTAFLEPESVMGQGKEPAVERLALIIREIITNNLACAFTDRVIVFADFILGSQ